MGAVLDNKLLELRTTEGHLLRGKALGWSSEYGAGLLKITERGNWKAAKLSATVKSGEFCVGLGYPRNHKTSDDKPPGVRLGLVKQVNRDQWFNTSYPSNFNGHPVFNLRGELLGLQTSSDGKYSTFCHTASIRTYWEELVSGLNLDRRRLVQDYGPPKGGASLPSKIDDRSIETANAATVQIGTPGEVPSFSGVRVRD